MALKVAVLGTGTMGSGIAQIAAQAGEEVLLWNRKAESVEKGLALVRKGLDRLVKKETITSAQHAEILGRVRGVTAISDVKEAGWIVECVPEDFELKRELYEGLGQLCADHTIFATNTSSLSITALARCSGRADRFLGLHFFNPAPLMKLVEVVSGQATSKEVVDLAVAFAEKLGKIPVRVNDMPGFVVNRVVMPMINEAAHALMQGVASAESIDECMKLGCNHPMGPLALADLVGLDVVHAILDALYTEFGNPHYKPCLLITKKVEAGQLGTKTGRGFYSY
jgi:3-hydroxybutyryl-CoA dehydrogenase